jgi:hypothetical protein
MKLLASLAFGSATLVASAFGSAQPAMADDDVTVGVRLGPLCVGLCVGGDGFDDGDRHGDSECYDWDCDGTGFYAHRSDYYHQRYDRRYAYDRIRDDGYAGYRRRYDAWHQGWEGEQGYGNEEEGDGNDE